MGTTTRARRANLPISYSQRLCGAMGSTTWSMDRFPLRVGCEALKVGSGGCSSRLIQGMQAVTGQLEEADEASKGVLGQVETSQGGSHVFLRGQVVIGRHAMVFQQVFQPRIAGNDRLPGIGMLTEFPQPRLHGASHLAELRI